VSRDSQLKIGAHHGADPALYVDMNPSPTRLIDDDGEYIPGWFEDFRGELNTGASRARWTPLQSWFHVQFVSATHLVVANIADLRLGGNVALLVLDRDTGQLCHGARTRLLWRNGIRHCEAYRTFEDPDTGSRLSIDERLQRVEIDMTVGGLRLVGQARAIFDRPFVQTTSYGGGRGTLQWWGCLEVEEMSLVVDGSERAIPPGTLGLYDRTLGHRRSRQNWNWLAAIGETVDGERFAIQAAQDRGRAAPLRTIHKAPMWLDGELLTPSSEAKFTYAPPPGPDEVTGDWAIDLGEAPGRSASLTFRPAVRRRERTRLPGVLRADFNQYYGELSGVVRGRREVELRGVFAVAEDSFLSLL